MTTVGEIRDKTDIKMDHERELPFDPDNFDFSSSSTESFLSFLQSQKVSLAVTSYDCQRLIIFREKNNQLDTHLVPVARPRGVAVTAGRLTVAAYTEIINYARHDNLLERLKPEDKDQADSLFLPLNKHITGEINVHDIAWGTEGLWLVNSRFSCLCTLQPDLSFKPRWFPPFIDGPTGDGAGHLNGMAMDNGKPAYVTCFGAFFGGQDWKNLASLETGLLIDVQRDEIVLDGMWMPHSPRVYQGKVYLCNSGYGEVICYDPVTKKSKVILTLPGFTRAITFWGGYMLVCCSKIRQSDAKAKMPVADRVNENYAGVYIVNLTDYSIVAYNRFDGDVSQLYDIAIIPDSQHPMVPSMNDQLLKDLFVY
ncbi:MAG: TIGR03032 family protein [Reinekea sp.]